MKERTKKVYNMFIKINTPIDRSRFFFNSLVIGILCLVPLLIGHLLCFLFGFWGHYGIFQDTKIGHMGIHIPFIILSYTIFVVMLLGLSFINYAKRISDISGNITVGIILSILLFIFVGFISTVTSHFFLPSGILYAAMIILPGKLIKN